MTKISKAAFNTTYANSAGTFADNTTRAISEADMRQFSQDIKDSCLFELDTNLSQIVSVKITISSAQVLALNATPQTIVAAQGAGTIIEPLSINYFLDYNSIAYATNTDLEFRFDTSIIYTGVGVLANTSDYYSHNGNLNFSISGSTWVNQALTAKAATGNPTAGNSPVYVYVTYRVITL